jgi:hypothetical protein
MEGSVYILDDYCVEEAGTVSKTILKVIIHIIPQKVLIYILLS